MEEIRSKIDDRVLHLVHRMAEMRKPGRDFPSRVDIVPPEHGLQVSCLKLMNEQTFKPHKHIPRPREIPITQECWIVVMGIVRVTYYDTDDTIIGYRTLNPGDVSITLEGAGHTYKAFTTPTFVYECKTGPFVGVEADKVLIGADSAESED